VAGGKGAELDDRAAGEGRGEALHQVGEEGGEHCVLGVGWGLGLGVGVEVWD